MTAPTADLRGLLAARGRCPLWEADVGDLFTLRWRSSLIRGAGGCSGQASHGIDSGRECRIMPFYYGFVQCAG